MTGPLVAASVAFAVAVVLTPLFRRLAKRFGWIDKPNERSSHVVPTPRTGGKAILLGISAGAVATGLWRDASLLWLLGLALVLAVLGMIDDAKSLGWRPKFLVQLAAAVAVLLVPGQWPGPLLAVVAIFWIAGVTNAFNFMDGVNGIAALEAMICGVVMGLVLLQTGDLTGGLLCFAIAGAAGGFFPWNAFTGSIFMGDVGSLPLGFLFAALVVRGVDFGIRPWILALPLLPFLLDTGWTLLRRVARWERIFEAHRTHSYQRLTDLGWSHLEVSLLWGGLAAAGGAVALAWEALGALQLFASAGLIVLHAVVFAAIAVRHRELRPAK